MKKTLFIVAFLITLGCGGLAQSVQPLPTSMPTFAPTWTFRPLPSPTETATLLPTLLPTDTATATASPSPTSAFTATLTFTPAPQFVIQGPGKILAPILLYHQIGYSNISNNPYYVSPEDFENQMQLLKAWGYQTITVSQLANAILKGAELPVRPIVLTFDDGDENTYSAAFPILQKYNFVATAYIVYNYIGVTNYMTREQIRALYAAGWEIGSHSLSHKDLTRNPKQREAEIIQSRNYLELLFKIPIATFSYPFGAYDDSSLGYIHDAGYIAAVGLGPDEWQGPNNIFYLYRQDIQGSFDMNQFAKLLPWQGNIKAMPTPVTVVP